MLRRKFSKLLERKAEEVARAARERAHRLVSIEDEQSIAPRSDTFSAGESGGLFFSPCLRADPLKGVCVRGISLPELGEYLPKFKGEVPVEVVLWLLLTGSAPNEEEFDSIKTSLSSYALINHSTMNLVRSMARFNHPINVISIALLHMQKDARAARPGRAEPAGEDGLCAARVRELVRALRALPELVGTIYGLKYGRSSVKNELEDWAGAVANALGRRTRTPLAAALRIFFAVHAAAGEQQWALSSALADSEEPQSVYALLSSQLNLFAFSGRAHPIEQSTRFLLQLTSVVRENYKGNDWADSLLVENITREFVAEWLKTKELPGFDKVATVPDTKHELMKRFALKSVPESPLFVLAQIVEEVVQKSEEFSAQRFTPTAEFISGLILHETGLQEIEIYPVLLLMAHLFGCSSNILCAQAIGTSLEVTAQPSLLQAEFSHI